MRVKRRGLVRALAALALIYSVLHFAYSGIYAPFRSLGGDFYSAFPGSFVAGYNPNLLLESPFPRSADPKGSWGYGPGFHLVTLPLTLLSSYRLIDGLVLLSLWIGLGATAWLWWSHLSPSPGARLLLAFLWLNFSPLYEALGQRGIEVIELFLISLAFVGWKKRPAWVGVAVGLAASIKILPALLLPYVWWKRRTQMFLAGLLTLALVGGVGTWVLGLGRSATWNEYWAVVLGEHQEAHINNQALTNLVERWFLEGRLDEARLSIRGPERARRLGGLLSLGVLGLLVVYAARRVPRDRAGPLALEMGIVLVAMVMLVNRNQTYYLLFALPGFTAAILHLLREKGRRRHLWGGALLLSYLLMSPVLPMGLIDAWLGAERPVALDTWKFWGAPGYGGLLLLGVLLGVHRRAVRREELD